MAGLQFIVLLTARNLAPTLSGALIRQRSQLKIISVETRPELDAIPSNLLDRARLIGFVTGTIVPKQLLNALGYGAYNFHPGPPEYPGWCPALFAVREGARRFGATAHCMAEQVDSGPIVDFVTFTVPSGIAVPQLEAMAFVHSARLFWGLAPLLAAQEEPIQALPIAWGTRKCTRKRYAELCASDMTPSETAAQNSKPPAPPFGAINAA